MSDVKDAQQTKADDLLKYYKLVEATLHHMIDELHNSQLSAITDTLQPLLPQAKEHFEKGRLSRLKQWFRDLTEGQIETRNFSFNNYLKQTTGYDVDIFEKFYLRIQKIIDKGRITSDQQFYDIGIYLDHLCQLEGHDKLIQKLNSMVIDYEAKRSKKV